MKKALLLAGVAAAALSILSGTPVMAAGKAAAAQSPLYTLPDQEGWRSAYAAFLKEYQLLYEDEVPGEIRYDLGYIDSDNVPELIICGGNALGGYYTFDIYTYSGGEVVQSNDGTVLGDGDGVLSYFPQQNILLKFLHGTGCDGREYGPLNGNPILFLSFESDYNGDVWYLNNQRISETEYRNDTTLLEQQVDPTMTHVDYFNGMYSIPATVQ